MTVKIWKHSRSRCNQRVAVIYHNSRDFHVKRKTSYLLFLDFHETKTTPRVVVWLAALPYSLSSPSVQAGILQKCWDTHSQHAGRTTPKCCLFDFALWVEEGKWCTIVYKVPDVRKSTTVMWQKIHQTLILLHAFSFFSNNNNLVFFTTVAHLLSMLHNSNRSDSILINTAAFMGHAMVCIWFYMHFKNETTATVFWTHRLCAYLMLPLNLHGEMNYVTFPQTWWINI